MFSYKREIPEGMEDVLREKRQKMIKVEEDLRRLYSLNGYCEIQTPTFEYFDVFASLGGELQQDKMVKLIDSSGKILVLRPDMTTPIARMVATKFSSDSFPLRLSYNANVFRVDYTKSGREKEFTQSGVELLGIQDPIADAEVINLAIESLISQGINEFQIDIGHTGFFRAVMDSLGVNPKDQQELQRIIHSKNMVALEEFLLRFGWDNDTKELLKALPLLFGTAEAVFKDLERFKLDSVMEREIAKLKDILEVLNDYGVADYIALDLGLVSEMDYYTGIIFRGLIKDVGYTVLSGGRYDNLVGNFGMDCPATGFAININRLFRAMETHNVFLGWPCLDYSIVFDDARRKEAFMLAKALRELDFSVELTQRSLNDKAASFVLTFDNTGLRVLDIGTGIEREETIDSLLESMQTKAKQV